jgi:LysM repeat protein
MIQIKSLLKILALFVFLYTLISPASVFANANARVHKIEQSNIVSADSTEKSKTDSIIDYAKTLLKKPYYKGAVGPNFFDCSGFTSYVFSHFGYELPRIAHEQSNAFHRLRKNQIDKGDLVFFEGRRQNGQIGHVGIVVDVKDEIGNFDFIHASAKSGVTISNSREQYYKKRFLKAVRVVGGGGGVGNVNRQNIIPSVQVTEYVSPAKYHKVRSGETLSLVARRYDTTVDELKRKNNLSSSVIFPDQLLKIVDEEKRREILHLENFSPNDLYRDTVYVRAIEKSDKPLEKIEVAPNTDTETQMPPAPAISPSDRIHKVQKSEPVYMISLKYGVSIEDIENYNNIKSSDVKEGMILKIPNVNEQKP